MGVDKGYGSGKPLTAAQSRGRRRVAAGQLSKGKKSTAPNIREMRAKQAASPVGQAADLALGFLLPGGKISQAATRIAKVAKAAAPIRAAEAASKSKIASRAMSGVSDAASEAYSNYLKMERRIGSGATDMLVGSEGKYIQRARDTSYQIANAAGEAAIKARDLALRTANRTDTAGAAAEIKRRLAALQRAKRNR